MAMFGSIDDVAMEIAKSTERHILDQLNEFISRDLIRIETTGPTFIQERDSAKITIQQSCRLILKDQEYIESLEKENAKFKERLDMIYKTLDHVIPS